MKDKVKLVHNLDCNVVDPEEYKSEHAQQFKDFIIKECHNTKKLDAKIFMLFLNIKEVQSKLSNIEDQNK